MENAKPRLWGIDVLRLVAAFFVVCQHIPGYWGIEVLRPVSRTAVILFFMISGYFLYDENKVVVRRRCIKSIKKSSCIYGWALLIYGLEALYIGLTTSSYDALVVGPWKIFTFFMYCSSPFFPYGYHLWFLIALIEAMLLIALLSKKINIFACKWIPVICVLLLLLGVFFTKNELSLPLKSTFLIAFPSIVLGGVIRAYKLSAKSMVCLIGVFLCSLISVYESSIKDSSFYYATVLLSMFIFVLFLQMPYASFFRRVAQAGSNYSLGIYIIHPLIIDISVRCVFLKNMSLIMNPLSIFLISSFLSFLFFRIKFYLKNRLSI